MNWRKAILIPVLMLVLVLVLENPHVTLAQGGDGDGTEHPQSDPVEVKPQSTERISVAAL